jgi:biotin transport system substrate-specific component
MATNTATNTLETLRLARLGAFRWRYQASLPWKITLALLMAGLTGLLAQVRIALPFTPVPITGQTFAVLLAGVLLGRKWGGVSLGIYAILGLAGLPWFNGGSSGLSATGGYLIGFVLAALFLGYYTDKYPKYRGFIGIFGLMFFASLMLVYIPGLLWLGFWLHLVKGSTAGIISVISLGAVPFIAGDILKAGLAAAAARILTPKESFTDKQRLT